MSNDKYRHMSLIKLDIERPRRARRGHSTLPERNHVEHGLKLSSRIRKIHEEFAQRANESPPAIEPVLVFRIKVDQRVDENHLERSGLLLLDEEKDKKIVVLSQDNLRSLNEKARQYTETPHSDQRHPRNNWLAALTDDMELIQPADRQGWRLRNAKIETENFYRLDIELRRVIDSAERDRLIGKLTDYVEQNGGRILDKYVKNLLCMVRILILGQYVDPLLGDDNIRLIDLPPEPTLRPFEAMRTSLDRFSHSMSTPPENAPGLCVIDSGIMAGHPMLSEAIGDTKAFPESLGNAIDEHGHGTLVSGVALYGDVQTCVENLAFEPELYLYIARVLNAQNRFDDDQLIVTQMENAIRYFHSEYNCRIFNISIGDSTQVYDGGKPSAWAYVLDTLARELDVLIVVSAGNIEIRAFQNEDADRLFKSYPSYLLNGTNGSADTRIIEPATAANVLTVGSLAHSNQSYQGAQHENDVDLQPIAQIDGPSPFTRTGPGVNNAIKPDICEYGGNSLWRGKLGLISNDPQLSIISTNKDFLKALFATGCGTSMAAPKVSHLAGLILKHYPNISANLVRALIAGSSNVPDVVASHFSDDDALRLCGYGKPDLEKAIYSSANRVTLVADESILLNHIHVYEIPIPDEFQQLKGTRQISISLAYDPPVRNRRIDYLGIKMGFKLFRGLEPNQIVSCYGFDSEGSDTDSIGERYECDLKPTQKRREFGTLQKGIFIAKQNKAFTNYGDSGGNFHVLVFCRPTWASPPEFERQKYALAVTIEHIAVDLDLYGLISQQLQSQERVRIRR